MDSKGKAMELFQTKLSFSKRNTSTSGPNRQKKQRLDGLEDGSLDKDDLEPKSPCHDGSELDDGADMENNGVTIDIANRSAPLSPLIRLTEKSGDIFSAPPNTLLIHACNAVGAWGGGIAKAFKQHYPDAYQIYRGHCQRSVPGHLVGTALLIAPRAGAKKQHYIGCLFTSKGHGKTRDKPERILAATGPAMRDLLRQVAMEGEIGEMRMCRINSGLFAVPWEDSKKAIEELALGKEEVPEDGEPWRIVVYMPV